MQSFMIKLLTGSVTMSALALLYMAITPLLSKRYSEKGRYYAWLIIVIGLIIPFRPQWGNAIVKVDVSSETATPIIQIGNGTPVTIPALVENAALPSALPSISWWQIAAAVWLAGVIAFLAYHAIKHFCFVKITRRWSENITDEQTLTLFQSLKTEMGISKRINLYMCSCAGSPMMIGFVNPRILLPKADLAHDELRFILKHELVHYKRKDLSYKYLVLVATALHWFNPVVYLISKAIDVLCEISCDAEVIQSTDADTRQHYSETIIGVVKYQSKLKTALSTNFYGGKKGMKKRIFSIMDTSKKKAGIAIVCCMLILVMGTGMAFAASSSASTNSNYLNYEASSSASTNSNEIEQRNAGVEKAIRESNAKVFSTYEKYGLTYNKEENRLYYNGELVRYFEDNQNTDGTFSGNIFPNFDGNIDVHAVRDTAGKLTGVEPYSQADFDARTLKMQNDNVKATSGESAIEK